MDSSLVPLPGSDRGPLNDAVDAGLPDASEDVQVSVLVRPRSGSDKQVEIAALNVARPAARKYLTREAFAERHGASTDDISQVEAWAQSQGLTVLESSLPRRCVILSGAVSQMEQAFGVSLTQVQIAGKHYRVRNGPVHVPKSLLPIITGVFGLDNRIQSRSQMRFRPAASSDISYTPLQVAAAYTFPKGTGTGQTIALIELGGGYKTADLRTYFHGLGVAEPKVKLVRVDGGRNKASGDPDSADGEVMLDIEVAGAVAPNAHIVVYFTTNTDQGFLDAVTTAIHDTTNKPDIISISWGGPESSWTSQSLQAFDQAFADAATMGVTVCCASGDNGSSDGATDGLAHVDFPASSPHALACGGTRLVVSASGDSQETVWNDGSNGGAGGGGVSDVFPLPSWQSSAHVPVSANASKNAGRGVPDVAGDADPATGYTIRVDGQQTVVGGTSAVAPLWAGLIALLNQSLGSPVGFINSLLYASSSADAFHDIVSGNNGAYSAGPGWDACTGLGSPKGDILLQVLSGTETTK